jgi:hypothetical protein
LEQYGGPPCPPILVGTVADPTIAQDQSFFFDLTGRFFAGGWVGFEYRISNKEYRMMKCGIASL